MTEENKVNRRSVLKSAGVASAVGLSGLSVADIAAGQEPDNTIHGIEISPKHDIEADFTVPQSHNDEMPLYFVDGDELVISKGSSESQREILKNSDRFIRKRTGHGMELLKEQPKILPHKSTQFLTTSNSQRLTPILTAHTKNKYNYPNIKFSYSGTSVTVKIRGSEEELPAGTREQIKIGEKKHMVDANGEARPVDMTSYVVVRNHGELNVYEK